MQVSSTCKLGKCSSQLSMVASAGNAVAQNPFRPAQKPYSLPSKLRSEFAWMLPEDGLSFEDRLKQYVSKGELQVSVCGQCRGQHSVTCQKMQEGDGITLKNWWLNYREACKNSPSKDFAVDEYFALLVRRCARRIPYATGHPSGRCE